jgi:peptide alpha-N-acetyltransferase
VLNLGRALKKYVASYTHFHDFIFDQMDFHDYCPRRSQLNSYLRMIQHCDVVRNHPQFLRAVRGILQCYALLYDQQQGRAFLPIPLKREATPPKPSPPTLPVKSQPPAAGAAARTGKPKKKYGKILHPVEKDPDGLSLLVEDPLAKAETYIDESFPFNKNDLAFQLAAFEIYIRLDASRFLLALRCLKRAAALDAQHAGLHFALCRLWRAVLNTPADALPPVVRHVLSSELAALLSQSLGAAAPATPPATLENMASLGEHNLQYHAAHPASLPHTLAVARVINLLEPTQTAAFLQDHLITIHPAPSVHSLKEMTEAYLALRSPADLNQPQLLANLCVKAHELYPYAPLFRPLP